MLLLIAMMLAAVRVTPAFAAPGDCDGTPSDDVITCSSNPTNPDTYIGLDLGDDVLVVDAGVTVGQVLGDSQPDRTIGSGDGGDDTIVINGESANQIVGDFVTGNGGNDTITINGKVSNAVWGDGADLNGGNDTIIVNGIVVGVVIGDGGATGNGGNRGDDTIIINGEVTAYIHADFSGSSGGNDTVVLGVNAVVGGDIDGGGGIDTLSFHALTQAQANALNPAGDTTTVNGHTYTWLNFENLIGLLEELAERGLRVFFVSDALAAVESNDGDGINFFAKPGRIAFVSYESLDDLDAGESASYHTPHSAGWYAVVTCLGADADHAGRSLYHVQVFAADGASIGQFTFSN